MRPDSRALGLSDGELEARAQAALGHLMPPGAVACSSCGTPIYFATTKSGKQMPVTAAPCDDGTVILYRRGVEIHARVISLGVMLGPGEKRRKSHFADCRDAAKHRRKR